MERNHLCAEEMLPVLDALGDVDDLFPLTVDHLLRRPDAAFEALLLDVEPSGRTVSQCTPECS